MLGRPRPFLAVLGAALFLTALAGPSRAQTISFGKNKIQYTPFDWHVLSGAHVDLYYYPEEREIAELALSYAEASYRDLEIRFGHHVRRRVPLIIYSSHQDFEQTNLSPYFLPEGVAGFTEFGKGRVAVPFDGSLVSFRHTIHHEMVHVFQLSILDTIYEAHVKGAYVTPPLWFSEGLADYWSEEWNSEGDLFLRDLVLSNRLPAIPDLWRYDGTFVLYKIGQDLCGFLEKTYGADKLPLLYTHLWTGDTFDDVMATLLGEPVAKVTERWHHSLRQRYYPEVSGRESLALAVDPLATRGGANFTPVAIPDSVAREGGRFAFLSPRSGYTDLYTASLAGPDRDVRVVVKGQRRAKFESLHPFRSRIDVDARGRLVFASKYHERDAIFVHDLARDEITAEFRFPGLVGITSPSWSGDGRRIVFSGLSKDGRSDLYVVEVEDGALTRLTNDRYQDLDPTWSPDGRWIVFASDRTAYGEGGARNLFRFDAATWEIRYLTAGEWRDASPRFSNRGDRIAFTSDRAGTPALYTVDLEGNGNRVTDFLGGVFDPAWLPDDSGFLFTGFSDQRFAIHRYRPPESPGPPVALAENAPAGSWSTQAALPATVTRAGRYRSQFSLDIAQGGVAFEPSQSAGEGLQAAFTDMMGNQIVFLQISNTAESSSDILSRMNAGVTYINLSHRLNYGIGAFHYAGDFLDELGYPFFERRAGVDLLGSYPFSKFNRVESRLLLLHSDRERDSFRDARRGFLVTHYLSLIRDTSLWLATGPIDGERMNLTVGTTANLTDADAENLSLQADLRRYFRFTLRSALAVRVQGRVSEGSLPSRFILGGTNSLRGYPRRSFYGTRSLLVNTEYRFPLLEGVLVGTPLGTVGIPGIQAAFFVDWANAWEENFPKPDPKGSLGVGLRTSLYGFLTLRMDFARRTDWKKIQPGLHTEFFVGWNY